MFYHSLVSDWNHGNAHFLRGVASELLARGHEVILYEPHEGWSIKNLVRDHGEDAVRRFYRVFPHLRSRMYKPDLDVDAALADVNLVIVHEWNEPWLVAAAGQSRR